MSNNPTPAQASSPKEPLVLYSETSSEANAVPEQQADGQEMNIDEENAQDDNEDLAALADDGEQDLDDEIFELGGGNDYVGDEDNDSQDEDAVQASTASLPAPTTWTTEQQVPARLHNQEVFTQHPTDPAIVVSTYTIPDPYNGGVYTQTDHLPQIDTTAQPSGDFHFIPSLEIATIPRKDSKGRVWQYVAARGQWEHPTGKVWKPIILFRRFDTATHRYIDAYVGLSKLQNVDPNNSAYSTAYNKWVKQIQRRRDSTYMPTVFKDHWTTLERWVMYDSINYLCHTHGAETFGFQVDGGVWGDLEMEYIAARINAAAGGSRNRDSVRSQIVSAHPKKNKVVLDLMQRAKQLRQYIEHGRVLTVAEQFPENAIALADFPVLDNPPVAATRIPLTPAAGDIAPAAPPRPVASGSAAESQTAESQTAASTSAPQSTAVSKGKGKGRRERAEDTDEEGADAEAEANAEAEEDDIFGFSSAPASPMAGPSNSAPSLKKKQTVDENDK
ncbi:hypothetical protein P153DRAFT_384918 [Dothidotthia symphoricarpi CBS 119687]|uniref:Uncharacterized protein n=1 Tax=Dothidotthia symphoricarpi CBS 119687 TaxID=1392245 RepID=A0A6A6AFV5_9PLEO|nr:uncharacterized protein P153DRAFT_384918 [Dothidotthia symphoricarpi CBS 119687]KAF2130660.1 hypothetical protein P153DRAFT_384918 [Dothidotthia symphoricarpi CBS 119687]